MSSAPFINMGIRGIDNPFGYVGQVCPLPLWGILAHTLVHRPEVGELDCAGIDDMGAEGRPLPEEFPWLPAEGSLLIIPLRGRGSTIGAAVLYAKQHGVFRAMGRKRFPTPS